MLAIAAGVAFILYQNRPQAEMKEPNKKPVTVDAVEAVPETLSIPISAQGTVAPLRRTSLVAEVAGRIIEVAPEFNVGGFVAANQILLRIDPSDYQTALLRAQAAVASAESTLAQEKGRAEVALQEWKKLPAGSQRSEEAKALYLRKPQLEQAESELLAARADLDTARDNLERSQIRAPYSAIISGKSVELGQYVSPGTAVAEVFSVDFAEVRLPIPQSKLEYLDVPGLTGYEAQAPIDLSTDVGGKISHWPAFLHRSEGSVDERSRVLYTVARITDPYALQSSEREPLRVGTFVNATIQGKNFNGLIALPRRVLHSGNQIWVIDDEQRLRPRTVEVLRAGGDQIYVSSGLDAGELVSLTGVDRSLSGAEVDVVSRISSDALRRGDSGDSDGDSAAAGPETEAPHSSSPATSPPINSPPDTSSTTSTESGTGETTP